MFFERRNALISMADGFASPPMAWMKLVPNGKDGKLGKVGRFVQKWRPQLSENGP